ncbi:MAG: TRAP transporter large permease [Lachnospiraceae bacterium]|nr:TRAP transporter large permease [Lachnospiraceae bacterium]
MTAVLFISLAVCLAIGVPVGFAIGISSMAFLMASGSAPLAIMSQKLVDGLNSFPLLALPLFVIAGDIMSYGCTPRLIKFANLLLGRAPGGLGSAGIAGSAVFGAISGSGVATTAAMGGIVGPEMVKNKYKPGYTASVLTAAGVLGSVIPPSLPLVVYASASNQSIRALFMASLTPGLVCIAALIVFNTIVSKRNGYGSSNIKYTVKEKIKITLDAIPTLLMPVIVLGSVLGGIMTPTESAVVAVVYSFILATFLYKELKFKDFINITTRSVITTSAIMFIMACAAPFGWIVAFNNIPSAMAASILAISSNKYIVLLLLMILILFLGTFMEGISIILILTPILLPIMKTLGVDLVHFGILINLNICIGAATPPLAVCLFTMCRILKIRVEDSFPDILYVVAILSAVLVLLVFVPQIAMWLPARLYG